MSLNGIGTRVFWFILRRMRWIRYALYIVIPLLLLNCGFAAFLWSIHEFDATVKSLLLNISAGFIGSFFTFVIIGVFEFLRSRINFFEFSALQLTRISDIAIMMEEQNTTSMNSIEQINRLDKIIDFETNPEQSLEIMNSQKQLADHLVTMSKGAVFLAEDRMELVKAMFEHAVALRYIELVGPLRELYNSCKAMYEDAKLTLDLALENRAALAKKQAQANDPKSSSV